MTIIEYIEKQKKIQNLLLVFIDSDDNVEENYQNLLQLLQNQKIKDNKSELKSFLHLLLHISDNHHRSNNFFGKIERILLQFKDEMTKYFSNFEIYSLFETNKRIVLFLLEEQIMIMDKTIYDAMYERKLVQNQYVLYFTKETHPFMINEVNDDDYPVDDLQTFHGFLLLTKSFLQDQTNEPPKTNLPKDFDEKRKIGENDEYFCKLIREDSIDEFIKFVKMTHLSLHKIIKPSMYETNPFLADKEIKLIEYAAFFGSFHIFKYLTLNGVKLHQSIWIYAIHGNNPEIIHFIEEKKLFPSKNSIPFHDDLMIIEEEAKKASKRKNKNDDNYDYSNSSDECNIICNGNFEDSDDEDFNKFHVTSERCFLEAIKCHHNDIANYILDNYVEKTTMDLYNEDIFGKSANSVAFQYYNYAFLPHNFNHKFSIFYAAQFDYINIVKFLLMNDKIELSMIVILITNNF